MAISINGNGTITGISAGGLPAGTVTSATLASGVGGKVLQVVESADFSNQVIVTDTTFADSGITATITPSATSSKILAFISGTSWVRGTGYNAKGEIRLLRASTEIARIDHGYDSSNGSFGARLGFSFSINRLDSPNTTSAIIYKVQHRLGGTNYSPSIRIPVLEENTSGNTAEKYLANKIQLMEIAA